MKPDIILECAGSHLRPLLPEDVHSGYIDGLNDPEVNRYLEVRRSRQTRESVMAFVRYNLQDDNAVLFGLWRAGDQQHCGTVRLHGIDYFHGTAHIGVCLFDKAAWGHRLGCQAVRTVTLWAVSLRLRWIEAGAYADNVASQKTFLAAGYDWIYDVPGKYLQDGISTVLKVYAFRRDQV